MFERLLNMHSSALKFFSEEQSLIPNLNFGLNSIKLLHGGKSVLRETFPDICEVSVGVFKTLYHKIFDAALREVIFLKKFTSCQKISHNKKTCFSYSGFCKFTFKSFWKYIFLLLENLSSALGRN